MIKFIRMNDVREEFSDLFYSSSWENAFSPEAWDIEGTKSLLTTLFGAPQKNSR